MTFAEPVTIAFKKSSGGTTITFEAGRTYLMGTPQLDRIAVDEQVSRRIYKVSKADSRIPFFHVGARRAGTQRLLLYNGSGGYGDQIMTWPVAKILSNCGFEVHVLTDPGNSVCWWNLDFIRSVSTTPLLWETVKLYDYFLHFEDVVNLDEHPDQLHPVDTMLRRVGIDPLSVDPKLKVVRPLFTASEYNLARKYAGKPVGLYQLAASNTVRSLPPNDSVFMLMTLASAFPGIEWLALYDEFVPKEYTEVLALKLQDGPKNVTAFTSPNLRELWALTEQSKIVVAPDSMMAHVAGVFGTPCVGLWGPVSPQSRVCYYKNHVAIHRREFCPHSPCHAYTSAFPKYCPPLPTKRKACDVMTGISPSEVVDAVKGLLVSLSTTVDK